MRFPEFSGEWKKCTIGELAIKVGSGVTPRGGESVYKMDGHPFVRSQNVGLGHLILDDIAFIDEETHLRQKSTELKLEDVLLNITGASIGRSALVNEQVVGGNVNQHVCIIRTKESLIPSFLCNFLLSNYGQRQIDSFQAGGNRQGLNFEQIKSIKIAIPSTKEQTKVAKLLQLIEERIATQNKIIEKLETLIKGIVELAFSHAATSNTLGCYITQISQRNKTGKDLPVLSVSNKHGFVEQSEQFEDRIIASDDTSNYKIVDINDFAYNPARINVGSIARLKDKECGIVSPMYICFRTSKDILPEYLELFFKTVTFSFEVGKRLEGSVRLCLSYESLCEIVIPIISIREQQSLVKMVTTFHSKLDVEKGFLSSYQSQKQCLLSQMFI